MPKVEAPSFSQLGSQLVIAARRASITPGIAAYKPMNHQIPFHKSKAFIKLFLGGNRAGKTVAGATDTVMKATGRHPWNQKFKPPLRMRAIGVDKTDGIKRIILPEIAKWIPPSELINGSWEDSYAIGESMLSLANGTKIEFMSYEQDVAKFAGTSRHWIWFDEEPPEDIFNENLLRLVDVEGECALTMTPLQDMSWTYDRLYMPGKNGGQLILPDGSSFGFIDVFETSTLDNEHLNPAMIAIATEGMSEEEKAARTFGRYFNFSGTVYGESIQKGSFIPSLFGTDEFETMKRKGWSFFGMLDHGLRNPTAYYIGAANTKGAIVILDEYYWSGRIIKENCPHILALNEKWGIQKKLEVIVADPSITQTSSITGTTAQSEYAEHGVYLALGNNDVKTGIQRVSKLFQMNKLFVTADCEKLIWELQRYRWAKYDTSKAKEKNNLKEEPLKKDDHGVDALRYGVMSRPVADEEVKIFYGNILRTSETARDYDAELVEPHEKVYYDDVLGTDW